MNTSLDFKWRRRAAPVALLSQPFWFYSSYGNDQWGIFALTALYTARWIQVFYRDWIKEKSK